MLRSASLLVLLGSLCLVTAANAGLLRFEVGGMTCMGCANKAHEALTALPGVVRAKVALEGGQASLFARRDVEPAEVRTALEAVGLSGRFPGDPAEPARLSAEELAKLDIEHISTGEQVTFADHTAPGKVTIFDFFADWCVPCHILTPRLERMVAADPNLALRTVDLVDWKTPVAKQLTRDYRIPGLPYVRIFDAEGKDMGFEHGGDVGKITALIRKARARQ